MIRRGNTMEIYHDASLPAFTYIIAEAMQQNETSFQKVSCYIVRGMA